MFIKPPLKRPCAAERSPGKKSVIIRRLILDRCQPSSGRFILFHVKAKQQHRCVVNPHAFARPVQPKLACASSMAIRVVHHDSGHDPQVFILEMEFSAARGYLRHIVQAHGGIMLLSRERVGRSCPRHHPGRGAFGEGAQGLDGDLVDSPV